MAMATRWYVDDETEVMLDQSDGAITVKQLSQLIVLTKTGTSAAELVDALMAAIIESGRDLPDLSRHGYELIKE